MPPPPGFDDPRSDSARAEALLRATNDFLRSTDSETLGRAISGAVVAMFGAVRVVVSLMGSDGELDLASAAGFSEADRAGFATRLRDGTPLLADIIAGGEAWSDDSPASALRERLAELGIPAGGVLPIRGSSGVVGSLSLLSNEPRTFGAGDRDGVRSIAAQAGLAHELITAREGLRRTAAAAEVQRRVATAFAAVTARLNAITDPAAVPAELAAAVRAATGASAATVALRLGETDTFEIAALDGATPQQTARIRSVPLTPEVFPQIHEILAGRPAVGRGEAEPSVKMGIGAGMAAPIVTAGRVRGFIAMAVEPGGSFDAGDWEELAVGFASVAASAYERIDAVAEVHAQRELLASAVAERTVQLREAIEELRSASEAKTDFLANVSHELRTPLTAILGFSEMLVRGDDGPLNPRQHEDAYTILTSSRRLVELIDDLLDISQMEGNRLELRMERVEIGPILRSVVEALRPLAAAKSIDMRLSASIDAAVVEADSVRLNEIFLNLVSNAVKFTGPGGRVHVKATSEPTADRPLGEVRVDVMDSGIGVPPEEQERIFEKFHRIGGPEYPGTGLGLAIARALVERHHGTLTIESTVGLGSTFTVRLPLAGAGDPT
jgi:signal transduction histidine kinase